MCPAESQLMRDQCSSQTWPRIAPVSVAPGSSRENVRQDTTLCVITSTIVTPTRYVTKTVNTVSSVSDTRLNMTSSDFDKLREAALQKGDLYQDPDFPACQSSVFYHQKPPFNFVWKRPKVS